MTHEEGIFAIRHIYTWCQGHSDSSPELWSCPAIGLVDPALATQASTSLSMATPATTNLAQPLTSSCSGYGPRAQLQRRHQTHGRALFYWASRPLLKRSRSSHLKRPESSPGHNNGASSPAIRATITSRPIAHTSPAHRQQRTARRRPRVLALARMTSRKPRTARRRP
jgi:hypothetical protein